MKPKQSYHTDMPVKSWIEKILPENLYPFAQLARWDRLIGVWLVLFPSYWGLALSGVQSFNFYFIFFLGAILVRGAGCTVNDILDRKIDASVERTQNRPLASERLSVFQALIFLFLQLFLAGALLFLLPQKAIILGLSCVVLILTYPLMKRVTYWPQLFLGFTMNWGFLIGVATGEYEFSLGVYFIYLAAIFWTVGYDTIYAFQDLKGDLLVNVKSTTMLFHEKPKLYLACLYALSVLFFGAGVFLVKGFVFSMLLSGVIMVHYLWQLRVWEVKNLQSCLNIFKSNRSLALLIFIFFICGEFINA